MIEDRIEIVGMILANCSWLLRWLLSATWSTGVD